MINNLCCIKCLDAWDAVGPDHYLGMKVEMTLVAEGQSWCKKHYREWRDRNKPKPALEPAPLVVAEIEEDEPGHGYWEAGDHG